MEMRRALSRRAIRVLTALGLLGCVVAGVVAYFGSTGKTVMEMRLSEEGSPAIMTDWWIAADHEGFLAVAVFFLIIGGLFGGATVAGAEWKAGTVTTLLTWEPRRLRLHGALIASSAILAFVISAILQVLFLASFVPAVLTNGTTDGADGGFWVDLAVVIVRTSALTALAAVLAVALATAARSTAFAVGAVFAWLAVAEGLIRSLLPRAAPWLWGDNIATVMVWERPENVDYDRGPAMAAVTILVYSALIVAATAASFNRRDVAAVT
jgi:ABC-2 type transport system permease protein